MTTTLALAHARQLVRDRRTAVGVLIVPLLFLGIAIFGGNTASSAAERDLTRFQMPGALFVALVAIALYGTVVPAVDLRKRGTLRLLSTTPLPRSSFLISLVPVRLALAAAFFVLFTAVSAGYGYLDLADLPQLIVTCLTGLAFLMAFGFVFAAMLPSGEIAEHVLSVVLIVLAVAGGAIVPLSMFPHDVATVLGWLPPALLADALRAELVDLQAPHAEWISWLVMLGGAAVLAVFAARFFRWDDPE